MFDPRTPGGGYITDHSPPGGSGCMDIDQGGATVGTCKVLVVWAEETRERSTGRLPSVSVDLNWPFKLDVPWSPENVLIDTVACLQRDFNDTRAESRYLRTGGGGGGSRMLRQPPDMGHLRRLRCQGLRVRIAGNNTGRCFMPLCSQTDGTMRPRRCNCSLICRGMP